MATLATTEELITRREPDHTVRVEPCAKWVRAMHNGQFIADSKRALLMFETRHLPVYYFPRDDVSMDLMTTTDLITQCPYKGDAAYHTLNVGGESVENVMWGYPAPIDDCPDISNYVAFFWNKVDYWFEEDEEVFVHARNPYKRIDCLPSTRHVRVELDGVTLAESSRPTLVFETGLPTRYYLPVTDVRADMLARSEKTTRCPYKGLANYYSVQGVEGGEDLVWFYQLPTSESIKIANLVCFFNERVDVFVDGELQERPSTPWSRR